MVTSFPHLLLFIFLCAAAHFEQVFAGKHKHVAESSIVSASASEDAHELTEESDTYEISIAVKFSDGGEVLLVRPFPENEFQTGSKDPKVLDKFRHAKKIEDGSNNNFGTFNIEDALKAAYDIDVEYIECKYENIEEGAKIRFFSPIPHWLKKTNNNENEMRIWELLEHLQRHDGGKWGVRGNTESKDEVFSVLFSGHSMVPLTNHKGIEVARFHLNATGLNIYKKDKNQNYVVADTPGMEESIENKENATIWSRGKYKKLAFKPPLFTRRLTYSQLKRIALQEVIGGRPWGGPFRCRHFAYEFVQAIVDDPTILSHFDAWPENMRRLDRHNQKNLDGSFAFVNSVQLMKMKAAATPHEYAHAHRQIDIEE